MIRSKVCVIGRGPISILFRHDRRKLWRECYLQVEGVGKRENVNAQRDRKISTVCPVLGKNWSSTTITMIQSSVVSKLIDFNEYFTF